MNRTVMLAGGFVGLTLMSVGAAYAVNMGIRGALALGEGQSVSKPGAQNVEQPGPTAPVQPIASAGGPKSSNLLRDIKCRSLMDSATAGQNCGPEKVGSQAAPGEECQDLSVTLVGTMVAEPATYSSALILATGQPTAVGVGVGQKIGDLTVNEIQSRRVLTDQGWLCIDAEKAAKTRKPSGKSTASKGDDGGVTKLSDTEFEVSTDLFDKYINDMEALAGMGRALTHRGPDGQPDGYRLTSIRRNTLPDKLGIRNGDIVHGVNGMPLTSMQGAMEAYNTLQSSGNFEVEVTRRGQKMTLKYNKN